MNIRLAEKNDLHEITEIINQAKIFMLENKINQWSDNYPNEQIILDDINNNRLYVAFDKEILGVATLTIEEEKDYENIDGQWLTINNYAVIHRIAVNNNFKSKNIAKNILDFLENKLKNSKFTSLRIDTHEDNKPMLRFIEKNGFKKCGIVYIRKTDRRIAFEKLI